MKKVILVVALIALGCGFVQGGGFFSGSFEDALQAAGELNKPILVDFYSNT